MQPVPTFILLLGLGVSTAAARLAPVSAAPASPTPTACTLPAEPLPTHIADGARVRLATPGHRGLRLAHNVVTQGRVDVVTRGTVPCGMAALLCALDTGTTAGDGGPDLTGLQNADLPETGTRGRSGRSDRTPSLQRVLLRLTVQPPLTLLNPGADLTLDQGEETVLRYRAVPGMNLDDLTGEGLPGGGPAGGGPAISGLPTGLVAQVSRLPGSRELSVRLTNLSLTPGQMASPLLSLPGGPQVALPTVQGNGGGRMPSAAAIAAAQGASTGPETAPAPLPSPQEQERQDRAGRWATLITALEWLRALVLLALALAAVTWLLARRRGSGGAQPDRTTQSGSGRSDSASGSVLNGILSAGKRFRRPSPRMVAVARLNSRPAGARPAGHDDPPAVEGLEYSEHRGLSLVTASGEVTGVTIPLGGTFDLGQLARVPHLSGLRAEQHRDGLQLLRIPADLEVSQGARLVEAGEVVRPGTLLGVAVARAGRAPRLQLGSLTGLGQPLNLRHEAATIRATGPYGQHAVVLPAGLSDLGAVFDAPVLNGLKVTLSGPHLLLVELPERLTLRRRGEPAPLHPGSDLPGMTLIDLPEDD